MIKKLFIFFVSLTVSQISADAKDHLYNTKRNDLTHPSPAIVFDELKLSVVRKSSLSVYDELTVLFNNGSNTASTDLFDFTKFSNTNLNFYSISSDNNSLSIDARPNVTQSISLGLSSNILDSFFIRTDVYDFPDNVHIKLIDHYLNTTTVLTAGVSYLFGISAVAASQGVNRFALQVSYGPRYYFTSAAATTDFNTLNNWSSEANGSGAAPASLSADSTVYYVQANAALSSSITSGNGSEIIVGAANTAAVNITVPSSITLAGKINIAAAQTGSNTLNIAGTVSILGSLDKTSTVNYLSGGQTIAAASYGNLMLSNTSGTNTASGNITVAGNLTIASGGKLSVGQHQLTLNNSDAAVVVNAGAVLDLSGSTVDFKAAPVLIASTGNGAGGALDAALITDAGTQLNGAGNVTVQRFLSQQQRGWRLVANPLQSDITYAAFAGNCSTPIDITYSNPSAKTYNPDSNTWTGITDENSVWTASQGIALFIRGISGEGINADFPSYNFTGTSIANGHQPSMVTLSVTGSVNSTAPAPVTTSNQYFYLIANPYAAPVSAAAILAASSGLSSVIATYNPQLGATSSIVTGGGYETHTPSGSMGGIDDVIIPAMGAFFVQDNGGGVVNIPLSAIINNTNYTAAVVPYTFSHHSYIKLKISKNNIQYDALTIVFDSSSTVALGDQYDFKKIPNSQVSMFSIDTNNIAMAVDERGLQNQSIALGLTSAVQGRFVVQVDAYNPLPEGMSMELKDNLLHTITPVDEKLLYDFMIDADTLSQGKKRFELIVKKASVLTAPFIDTTTKLSVKLLSNHLHGALQLAITGLHAATTMAITDAAGNAVAKAVVHEGINNIQLPALANGMYILSIHQGSDQWAKQIVLIE